MNENVKIQGYTPADDLLDAKQRKIIQRQNKRIEYMNRYRENEIVGLINSKILDNLHNAVNFCVQICENKEKNYKFAIDKLKGYKSITENGDPYCLNNCVNKRNESYKMLIMVRS